MEAGNRTTTPSCETQAAVGVLPSDGKSEVVATSTSSTAQSEMDNTTRCHLSPHGSPGEDQLIRYALEEAHSLLPLDPHDATSKKRVKEHMEAVSEVAAELAAELSSKALPFDRMKKEAVSAPAPKKAWKPVDPTRRTSPGPEQGSKKDAKRPYWKNPKKHHPANKISVNRSQKTDSLVGESLADAEAQHSGAMDAAKEVVDELDQRVALLEKAKEEQPESYNDTVKPEEYRASFKIPCGYNPKIQNIMKGLAAFILGAKTLQPMLLSFPHTSFISLKMKAIVSVGLGLAYYALKRLTQSIPHPVLRKIKDFFFETRYIYVNRIKGIEDKLVDTDGRTDASSMQKLKHKKEHLALYDIKYERSASTLVETVNEYFGRNMVFDSTLNPLHRQNGYVEVGEELLSQLIGPLTMKLDSTRETFLQRAYNMSSKYQYINFDRYRTLGANHVTSNTVLVASLYFVNMKFQFEHLKEIISPLQVQAAPANLNACTEW